LRHWLIPADSRFTYEGQSFSWRLKADVRRSSPVEILVQDLSLIPASSGSAGGRTGAGEPPAAAMRINWPAWRGEHVIYRRITPGRIDWARFPEIFVSLEPIIGERFIYNPFAGSGTNGTGAAAEQRVRSLWQDLYGRQPQALHSTVGLAYFLGSLAEGLRAGGNGREAAEVARLATQASHAGPDLLNLLMDFHHRDQAGEMTASFRSLAPFALEGEPFKAQPFLVIEDQPVLAALHKAASQPLIIYTGDLGPEVKDLLPQVCIFDSQDNPGAPPYLWWNSPKDLTSSKLMHVSTQPFYLRRYARRVAELWQRDYGRRPIIHARTSMSLNGRPFQPMVDPEADLATVPIAWLRHNPWIKDLETPRIPPSALAANPGFESP
jgi:hypothetical protein